MAKMDRPRRVRFVIALTIGLVSLAACALNGPLIAAFTMRTVEQPFVLAQDINAMERTWRVSVIVSGITFVIAVVCFGYCFILWAVSFIGPREEDPPSSGVGYE
jgi:hypothetical protein